MNLPHSLTRTVLIQARPETVFLFFTDSDRWASWWGKGSTIDPRPGGRVLILYPNAIEASGEVVEIAPPERIVFTYGYGSGKPIGPGTSQVTIWLEEAEAGTRLHFLHEFGDPQVRDEHVQGWRYHLSVFSNVAADWAHAGASKTVEAWFLAWSQTDAEERNRTLAGIAAPGIVFHDRFSNLEGLEDLSANIAGLHRFMPGVRLESRGNIRHCQGIILADWAAVGAAGAVVMSGTNAFSLDPAGRIVRATGFTNPMA